MNRLLIDIGNSRLKWAYADAQGIGTASALPLDRADWHLHLAKALANAPAPSQIAIAAVASDEALAALCELLARRWPDCPAEIAQSGPRLGRLRSAYAEPKRLGVDRFLACAAAAEDQADRLLVAVGTALTIDWVAASGQHRGGLILPAPENMRSALLAATARIEWRGAGKPVDFADNSEDALVGGTWAAACGAVERSFDRASKASTDLQLIVHGGGGPALVSLLRLPATAIHERPNLVFEGLLLWLQTATRAARTRQ